MSELFDSQMSLVVDLFSDKSVTLAKAVAVVKNDDGISVEYTDAGSAKRADEDEWSGEVASLLAAGRALADLGNQLVRVGLRKSHQLARAKAKEDLVKADIDKAIAEAAKNVVLEGDYLDFQPLSNIVQGSLKSIADFGYKTDEIDSYGIGAPVVGVNDAPVYEGISSPYPLSEALLALDGVDGAELDAAIASFIAELFGDDAERAAEALVGHDILVDQIDELVIRNVNTNEVVDRAPQFIVDGLNADLASGAITLEEVAKLGEAFFGNKSTVKAKV